MPIAPLAKNFSFGTLSAAISAGATSLILTAGHGARFDAIGAGQSYYLALVDYNTSQNANYQRFEIALATALSTDTFTITRAQEGTSALQFPITSGDNPALVKVYVADTLANLRRLIQGQGAIIQAGAPALTSESPEVIILTPAAPITVALPTTNVWAGRRFLFVNLGSAANTVTINASGGTTEAVLPGGQELEIIAYQDNPTTNAHWGPKTSYLPAATIDTLTTTTISNFTQVGAAVGSTPAAGKTLLGALATDGFGVVKSAAYFLNEAQTRWEFGGGAAKNIAGVGVDLASYVSGTGTAGADNTGQTVKSITLKANSLNAIGRGIRVLVLFSTSTATSINIQVFLNSVLLGTNTATAGGLYTRYVYIDFVDATHANYHANEFTAGAIQSLVGGNGTNVAGFAHTSDQLLEVKQSAAVGTHVTVFKILVDQGG